MKVAITGAGGYVGTKISNRLTELGFEVEKVPRGLLYGDAHVLAKQLSGTGIIIHLAGASILKRWTKKYKKEIYESRVVTTKNLVKAINYLDENQQPKLFISASAIGIYENGIVHTEESRSFSASFVSDLIKKWESASEPLPQKTRRVIFRIGLVLGSDSKTIEDLLPTFKLGLGGTIGRGKQAFPFIHIEDLLKAITWALQNSKTVGTYNLAAPENISNKEFTSQLATRLKRPAIWTIPKFFLYILFGKASVLLTDSPQVLPQRLLHEGFKFNYPTLSKSLDEILGK